MPSVYIATVYPCTLSIANGGFVIFVIFRGPGDKPLRKTTNFKRFKLQKNSENICRHHQFLLSSRHFSSQQLSCNNFKLSEVFAF